MPIDVERRLGFGVALRLRLLEDVIKLDSLEFHASEDVIAGSIDNAVKVGDPIADESFTQRLYNGNAATDARLIIQIGFILPGCRK